VLAAVEHITESGFTLKKGKSRGHIDAAVALCIAVNRAMRPVKRRAPLLIAS
jgi:hypothetical protein